MFIDLLGDQCGVVTRGTVARTWRHGRADVRRWNRFSAGSTRMSTPNFCSSALVLGVVAFAVHRLERTGTRLHGGDPDAHPLGGLRGPLLPDRLHARAESSGRTWWSPRAAAFDVGVAEADAAPRSCRVSRRSRSKDSLGGPKGHLLALVKVERPISAMPPTTYSERSLLHPPSPSFTSALTSLPSARSIQLAGSGSPPAQRLPVRRGRRRPCRSSLRRGLDAVGAAAEVDRVQVALEDLLHGLMIVV